MNWRGPIAGIIALIVLAGIVWGAWAFFVPNNSAQQEETPTPIPTETGGLLPIGSSASSRPVSSLENPIGFRGVCPDTWAGQQDTDGDSLPDSVEVVFGTDPTKADTDGDQFTDGVEVRAGYDPLNKNSSARLDSDRDNLLDNEECTWYTDPFNADSDGDGFKDGAEVANGFDPAKKGDGKGSDRIVVPTQVPVVMQNPKNTAIPTPFRVAPTQQIPPTGGAVNIALIPFSQLKIIAQSAPADVKKYLASLDTLRPQELTDGQVITDAITSAANGNTQPLTAARTRIQQFATALKGVAVPIVAQEYHQLYVSLIDFTATRLQTIEQNATSNQPKATQALLEIQNTLPQYVTQLASLLQEVEAIANR